MFEVDRFEEFPKIARLSRECFITEKIDGTNAQINIIDVPDCSQEGCDGIHMQVGSRTRWLDEKNDNHGFYKWAMTNRTELAKLGYGRHYGEWWGSGIQRGYGLTKGEKRFSLFNVSQWNQDNVPSCCHVVPILYHGEFNTAAIEEVLAALRIGGSAAAPGFMRPEGVVIYHTAASVYFKKTLEKDEVPKSLVGV